MHSAETDYKIIKINGILGIFLIWEAWPLTASCLLFSTWSFLLLPWLSCPFPFSWICWKMSSLKLSFIKKQYRCIFYCFKIQVKENTKEKFIFLRHTKVQHRWIQNWMQMKMENIKKWHILAAISHEFLHFLSCAKENKAFTVINSNFTYVRRLLENLLCTVAFASWFWCSLHWGANQFTSSALQGKSELVLNSHSLECWKWHVRGWPGL